MAVYTSTRIKNTCRSDHNLKKEEIIFCMKKHIIFCTVALFNNLYFHAFFSVCTASAVLLLILIFLILFTVEEK